MRWLMTKRASAQGSSSGQALRRLCSLFCLVLSLAVTPSAIAQQTSDWQSYGTRLTSTIERLKQELTTSLEDLETLRTQQQTLERQLADSQQRLAELLRLQKQRGDSWRTLIESYDRELRTTRRQRNEQAALATMNRNIAIGVGIGGLVLGIIVGLAAE